MIDLHSHILPGLDDGPDSLEEAVEVARESVAGGVTAIAATPHVRADYPTRADEMERGVVGLRAELERLHVRLDVLLGGEIDLEWLPRLEQEELDRFTLAQTGRYLLLEFPYSGWPLALESVILSLRKRGITPVLAHPERNPDVQIDPMRLEMAVSAGAIVQATASSLTGHVGRGARRTVKRLLAEGLVHLLASDAHGLALRMPRLAEAAEDVGDPALARHLTFEAPQAIVAGDPLPAPPPLRRRRLTFRTHGVESVAMHEDR